jgi:cobalt transporter subunit CbtA
MFQRIFVTALGAGIGVGLLIAALQHVALVPLILAAETYESGAAAHQHATNALDVGKATSTVLNALPAFVVEALAHDQSGPATFGAASPWRAIFTTVATTLTAVGFGLLLAGAFAVSGREVDMPEGLLWGLAGFTAFALAPAFGLPPELPGSLSAELFARQIWWVATSAVTAAALVLMVFARTPWAILIGVALLIVPHLIGAPQPPEGSGVVPPELAAAFAARALVVNAVFWALLGLATGALYARLAPTATT